MSSVSSLPHTLCNDRVSKPLSNKARVEQLEGELVRTRHTLHSTETRLAYVSRDLESLKLTLASVRAERREVDNAYRERHNADAQTIRELHTKIDSLNTQLVSLSSVLNAAKTLVAGALPQSQTPVDGSFPKSQTMGDLLTTFLRR
jgi:chromosome segregation ATPase